MFIPEREREKEGWVGNVKSVRPKCLFRSHEVRTLQRENSAGWNLASQTR
jgi:hypothetical protein